MSVKEREIESELKGITNMNINVHFTIISTDKTK